MNVNPYRMERQYHAVVRVVGRLWMGGRAAYDYRLQPYDLENIGEFTRENVQDWLDKHAGDFARIDDFRAEVGDTIIDWETEDGAWMGVA